MIPKTILQTSRHEPGPHVREQLSRIFDSTWSYVHFTDEEAISFLQKNIMPEFPNILEKFLAMPTGAHKADLFRYYYLFLNGGVFIDSDAMIKAHIDQICHEFEFFAVRSGVMPVIFQGFMGTTSGNSIIYEALKHAYETNPDDLRQDYLAICRFLYHLIDENTCNVRIKLFDEVLFDTEIAEVIDDNGLIILLHFFGRKAIPKIVSSSWVPRPWVSPVTKAPSTQT